MGANKLTRFVRDAAKVGVGLISADLMAAIWFKTAGWLPLFIWGIEFDEGAINVGIAFDVILLVLLIHYAWHPQFLEPTRRLRGLMTLVGIVTAAAALVHLTRIATGITFSFGSWTVPLWLSWVGALVTAYISYASFHFASRINQS